MSVFQVELKVGKKKTHSLLFWGAFCGGNTQKKGNHYKKIMVIPGGEG